mgnify:CR=1 FL=1
MPEEFGPIVQLKKNQVSEVLKTPYGYHIFKIVDVKTPRQLTFSESKKNITVILEENCANSSPMDQFQFERHGYFICDTKSTKQSIIFNRIYG